MVCEACVTPAAPLPYPCRPRSPAYYTLHFNGDAARSILDAELAAQQAQQGAVSSSWLAGSRASGGAAQQAQQAQQALRSYPIPATTSSSSLDSLDGGEAASDGPAAAQQVQQAQQARRILIGHSMGAAATAEELISNPEGVEAVVLVAPAIVALWFGPPPQPSGDAVGTGGLGLGAGGGETQPCRHVSSFAVDASSSSAAARASVHCRALRLQDWLPLRSWLQQLHIPKLVLSILLCHAGLAVVEELVSADDAPGELRRLASSPSMPSVPSSGVPLSRSASSAGAAGSADGAAGSNGSGNGSSGNGGSGNGSNSSSSGGVASGLAARGRRLLGVAAAVLKASWFLLARLLLAAANPLLLVLLRRLVRSRQFWERGLTSAWHNGQKVTREYVDAYRCVWPLSG